MEFPSFKFVKFWNVQIWKFSDMGVLKALIFQISNLSVFGDFGNFNVLKLLTFGCQDPEICKSSNEIFEHPKTVEFSNF